MKNYANYDLICNVVARLCEKEQAHADVIGVDVACFRAEFYFMPEGVPVTQRHLDDWGITVDDLVHNCVDRMNPQINTLSNMLFGGEFHSYEVDYDNQPLVITDGSCEYGASVILDREFLKKLTKLYHGGYYILPSSVYEIITVSDKGHDVKKLHSIVSMINAEPDCVSPDSYLSDKIIHIC